MSLLTKESTCATNSNLQQINNFFGPLENVETAEKRQKTPEVPNIPSLVKSKCASWINNQSFEIVPVEEPSKPADFPDSPLPDSVHSWHGLQRSMEKKRKKSKSLEPEKRAKIDHPPPSKSTFFEKLAFAEKEIQEKSSNWIRINGFWMEKEHESSSESETTTTKYDEIMSLFHDNPRIYDFISFDYAYKFDWNHYAKEKMQYVVFTKLCQSHSADTSMEVRKEDLECSDCGSTDLAIAVRLTVPLDLSEIPIPCYEDIQIHVSLLAEHILEKCGEEEIAKKEFSRNNCERMYNYYKRMMISGQSTPEYTKWFEMCKHLVKKCLHSKTLRLGVGKVVRRKFEQSRADEKKRCFIFGTYFDLE